MLGLLPGFSSRPTGSNLSLGREPLGMRSSLAWLGLEVRDLAVARTFYEDRLSLSVIETADQRATFAAGDARLHLRRPTTVPRGGVHTHFAFSIPATEYDVWWERLSRIADLEEHRFGEMRSLYLDDPDGHCVELGQRDVEGPGIDGIFEVVLEVRDLETAEAFYADLGFETVDRGESRRRVRMDGPVDLELWEPQLGLAGARGGLHVDLGFTVADPSAVVDAVGDRARDVVERSDGSVVIRDRDDHHLTFRPE